MSFTVEKKLLSYLGKCPKKYVNEGHKRRVPKMKTLPCLFMEMKAVNYSLTGL